MNQTTIRLSNKNDTSANSQDSIPSSFVNLISPYLILSNGDSITTSLAVVEQIAPLGLIGIHTPDGNGITAILTFAYYERPVTNDPFRWSRDLSGNDGPFLVDNKTFPYYFLCGIGDTEDWRDLSQATPLLFNQSIYIKDGDYTPQELASNINEFLNGVYDLADPPRSGVDTGIVYTDISTSAAVIRCDEYASLPTVPNTQLFFIESQIPHTGVPLFDAVGHFYFYHRTGDDTGGIDNDTKRMVGASNYSFSFNEELACFEIIAFTPFVDSNKTQSVYFANPGDSGPTNLSMLGSNMGMILYDMTAQTFTTGSPFDLWEALLGFNVDDLIIDHSIFDLPPLFNPYDFNISPAYLNRKACRGQCPPGGLISSNTSTYSSPVPAIVYNTWAPTANSGDPPILIAISQIIPWRGGNLSSMLNPLDSNGIYYIETDLVTSDFRDSTKKNISMIVPKTYQYDNFVIGYNSTASFYIHVGEAAIINKISVRVLDSNFGLVSKLKNIDLFLTVQRNSTFSEASTSTTSSHGSKTTK